MPDKIRTIVNIILAEEDIKRITSYLDNGAEDIDDILIEITVQASIIPLNGTKEKQP